MAPEPREGEVEAALAAGAERYRFGVFDFDARTGELRRAGARVRLRLQPARALTLLLARQGEVVGREELRAHLWPGDTHVDFDQGLNSCIKDVRAAIGDNAEAPVYIETLPRVGYRWVGPSERGQRSTPAPVVARPRRAWWPVAAAAALGALAGAGSLALVARPSPERPPSWTRITYRRGVLETARFAPGGEVVYSASFEDEGPLVHAASPGAPEDRRLGWPGASLVGVSPRGEVHLLGPRSERGGRQLLRAPLAGGAAKVLAEGVLVADLAPSGEELAAVRVPPGGEVGLRLEYPLGRELGRINSPSELRLSRDGARVAVVDHPVAGQQAARVVVFDRAGRAEVLGGDWAAIEGIAWSPAGSLWVTGARPGSAPALHELGADGSAVVRLSVGGWIVLHDFAADGRALVERVSRRGELRFGHEGQPERDLAWLDGSRPAALSDDGGLLLFTEDGEGGGPEQAAYVRSTAGGPPVRLGAGRASSLSGDGRTAYLVPAGDAAASFEVVPVGSGPSRRVNVPGLAWLQWVFPVPGGRLMVVGGERDHHGRVWIVEEGGGSPAPVTPEQLVTNRDTTSPDGSLVVAGCPSRRFCVYRTKDGATAEIPGLGDRIPIRFDATGRHLFVRSRAALPVVVERLELGSGASQPWRTLAPEDPLGVAGLERIVLTPDGRAWAYGFERRLSELYLVAGFGAGR